MVLVFYLVVKGVGLQTWGGDNCSLLEAEFSDVELFM